MAGDPTALTPNQVRGWEVFEQSLCATCHPAPLFSDDAFHNIGVRPSFEDPGRQAVSGDPDYAGRFRTPALLNVGLRSSFMHNGASILLPAP